MKVKVLTPKLVMVTQKDARALVRLLGVLQTHLESAIEASLVPGAVTLIAPGTSDVPDPADRPAVAKDRRDWRAAEDLIMKLTKGHKCVPSTK